MIYCPYCIKPVDNETFIPSLSNLSSFKCECGCCKLAFHENECLYFKMFIFNGKDLFYLYAYPDKNAMLYSVLNDRYPVAEIPATWAELTFWDPKELINEINAALAFQ